MKIEVPFHDMGFRTLVTWYCQRRYSAINVALAIQKGKELASWLK